MANKNKEKKSTEGATVVVKRPAHLINKEAHIDLNPNTNRYVLRHNEEFIVSDINQDIPRRTANEKFSLLDKDWVEPK